MRSNSIPAAVLTARVLHLHSSAVPHCLNAFQSLWTKPVLHHVPSCWGCEPSVQRLLSVFYLTIHPSIHPSLTPHPQSFHWQGRFLLLQSSWPIKLWEEGEQAEFSGLATPLWGHWLGLMLFTPHICSPGPMKRDSHGIFYGTCNNGPSFIRQQEHRGVSKFGVHPGCCQLLVYLYHVNTLIL